MPVNLVTQIRAVREAGYVERCHVVGRTSGYNLAQHQWGVATLCYLMWPQEPQLVTAALFHDVPERWTGDIPGQLGDMKDFLLRREMLISAALDLPSEHELRPTLKEKLAGADRLELWLWTLEEERRRGCREFEGFRTLIERRWAECPPPDPVMQVVTFTKEWGWKRLPEIFEEILT